MRFKEIHVRILSENTKSGQLRCPRRLLFFLLMALALLGINCGGGGGSSSSGSKNPSPSLYAITPTTAPAGSKGLTITVTGTNFVAGSSVRWNGSARTTTYVASTILAAAITPADLASAGTASITVFNPAPGGGTSAARTFTIAPVSALSIQTGRLPDATHGKTYAYTLRADGGLPPYSWTLASGALPAGLSLSANGTLAGTPPVVSGDTPVEFAVQVSDGAYIANTATQPLSILVRSGALGRNDACATATAITNGITRASISPYGDIDVYAFQGTAGTRITAQIYAQRLAVSEDSPEIHLDSFLELLNSNCARLSYNDDVYPVLVRDSQIPDYALPYTGTYYLRVSDLRGDGRPDFIYELHLTGAD